MALFRSLVGFLFSPLENLLCRCAWTPSLAAHCALFFVFGFLLASYFTFLALAFRIAAFLPTLRLFHNDGGTTVASAFFCRSPTPRALLGVS